MSELPQIDPTKLAQKLLAKNSELNYQVAQLEVLAEALRDERDRFQARVAELAAEKAEKDEPV